MLLKPFSAMHALLRGRVNFAVTVRTAAFCRRCGSGLEYVSPVSERLARHDGKRMARPIARSVRAPSLPRLFPIHHVGRIGQSRRGTEVLSDWTVRSWPLGRRPR